MAVAWVRIARVAQLGAAAGYTEQFSVWFLFNGLGNADWRFPRLFSRLKNISFALDPPPPLGLFLLLGRFHRDLVPCASLHLGAVNLSVFGFLGVCELLNLADNVQAAENNVFKRKHSLQEYFYIVYDDILKER